MISNRILPAATNLTIQTLPVFKTYEIIVIILELLQAIMTDIAINRLLEEYYMKKALEKVEMASLIKQKSNEVRKGGKSNRKAKKVKLKCSH